METHTGRASAPAIAGRACGRRVVAVVKETYEGVRFGELMVALGAALATVAVGLWYIDSAIGIGPRCVISSPPNPWFIGLFGVLIIAGVWFFVPVEAKKDGK